MELELIDVIRDARRIVDEAMPEARLTRSGLRVAAFDRVLGHLLSAVRVPPAPPAGGRLIEN